MKKLKLFIQLLLITALLFAVATACDKTDDTDEDFSSTGTVKDADGNKYNTVKIGTQVWMVENLKTDKYNDGTPIPKVSDKNAWIELSTGAYCNYDNLESNADTYGCLYNWHAVSTGKLAPKGWHVPTNDDWVILENYLISNGYSCKDVLNGNAVAKALCAKTHWVVSTNAGTPGADTENNNSAGFSALPGGLRDCYNGSFTSIGKYGFWWSSTENGDDNAYLRRLGSYDEALYRYSYYKESGFSVRLVKD